MIGALLLAAVPLVVPIPGRVIRVSTGSPGLLVLASEKPGETPVHLLRVPPGGGAPVTVAADLPKETTWAGTVGQDLMVAGGGAIRKVTPEGAAPWVRDPDLGEVNALTEAGGRLWTATPQTLISFGPERRDEAPVPATAAREGRRLIMSGPPFHALPGLVAAGPAAADRRRLRTVVARPPEPPFEAWARLPGPEQLLEHALIELDGRPLLVVATAKAGKLELFGEKLIRVYALEPDRTRQGAAPLFSVTSRMNLWQEATFHAVDVDRDGRQDLVVRYVKGMKSAQPALDAYLRRPDGTFDPRPRSTEIAVKDAEDQMALYGGDLDGDDRPDLVMAAGGRLLLFPGAGTGKEIVSRAPRDIGALPQGFTVFARREVSVGSDGFHSRSAGGETFPSGWLDLDADGRDEIILIGRAKEGDRIAIVGLPPAADAP